MRQRFDALAEGWSRHCTSSSELDSCVWVLGSVWHTSVVPFCEQDYLAFKSQASLLKLTHESLWDHHAPISVVFCPVEHRIK